MSTWQPTSWSCRPSSHWTRSRTRATSVPRRRSERRTRRRIWTSTSDRERKRSYPAQFHGSSSGSGASGRRTRSSWMREATFSTVQQRRVHCDHPGGKTWPGATQLGRGLKATERRILRNYTSSSLSREEASLVVRPPSMDGLAKAGDHGWNWTATWPPKLARRHGFKARRSGHGGITGILRSRPSAATEDCKPKTLTPVRSRARLPHPRTEPDQTRRGSGRGRLLHQGRRERQGPPVPLVPENTLGQARGHQEARRQDRLLSRRREPGVVRTTPRPGSASRRFRRSAVHGLDGKRAGTRLYAHKDIDPARIFETLAQTRANFLMTYDNAPEIDPADTETPISRGLGGDEERPSRPASRAGHHERSIVHLKFPPGAGVRKHGEQKTVGKGLSRPVAKGLHTLATGDDKRRPYDIPCRITRHPRRGRRRGRACPVPS